MSYPLVKRIFDIVCALAGLVVLVPAGLIIGLAIKLTDRGPVLFAQERVGLGGRPFRMLKFRSMFVNSEKSGTQVTQRDDTRITWIGKYLRQLKLDELPQLWNVLVGDMSVVGPRPEVPRYVAQYTPEQRRILDYKPGLTDLATMLFRHEEDLLRGTKDLEAFYLEYCLPKKIELNLHYEKHASLVQDIWIILQTLCPYWLTVLAVYAAALSANFWLAYAMHSDFQVGSQDFHQFWTCLLWVIGPQLLLLSFRGQMRGMMSYFSIPELRQTLFALTAALIVQLGLFSMISLVWDFRPPLLSILLTDFVFAFFSLCALRMALRLLREQFGDTRPKSQPPVRRVAIIGTSERATNLALDFTVNRQLARRVVAFFDDDPHTWNKRPHDIPVFGMPECLLNPEWLKKIDEVIVALPTENARRVNQIMDILKPLPLKVTLAAS